MRKTTLGQKIALLFFGLLLGLILLEIGLRTADIKDSAGADSGLFFRDFRVYKLFRLLGDRILYNIKLAETSRQRKKEVEDILTFAETSITGNGDSQPQKSHEKIPEEAAANIEIGDRYFEQDK